MKKFKGSIVMKNKIFIWPILFSMILVIYAIPSFAAPPVDGFLGIPWGGDAAGGGANFETERQMIEHQAPENRNEKSNNDNWDFIEKLNNELKGQQRAIRLFLTVN
jgi:hypothetical protein